MTVRKPKPKKPTKKLVSDVRLVIDFEMTNDEYVALKFLRTTLRFESFQDAIRHSLYREMIAQDMKPSTTLFAVRD